MLSLFLALTLTAPPTSRLTYEARCLYCHSETMAESRKLTEGQWRRLIERMRLKAPLLISRSEVPGLARFMVQTLKLGATPRAPESRPADVHALETRSAAAAEKKPEPRPPVEELPTLDLTLEDPLPEAPPASDEQLALERDAMALVSRRCSKCHTLGRVYGRLDTLERSLTTLERMRMKTGSGLTASDVALIERYLRSQF